MRTIRIRGRNFTAIAISLITICLAAVVAIAVVRAPSSASQPSFRMSDGAIPIQAKHLAAFDDAVEQFDKSADEWRRRKLEIEKIARWTLEDAGIPPERYPSYNIDAKKRLLTLKPSPTPTP